MRSTKRFKNLRIERLKRTWVNSTFHDLQFIYSQIWIPQPRKPYIPFHSLIEAQIENTVTYSILYTVTVQSDLKTDSKFGISTVENPSSVVYS